MYLVPRQYGAPLRYERVDLVIAILHTWFNVNLQHLLLQDVSVCVGGGELECREKRRLGSFVAERFLHKVESLVCP